MKVDCYALRPATAIVSSSVVVADVLGLSENVSATIHATHTCLSGVQVLFGISQILPHGVCGLFLRLFPLQQFPHSVILDVDVLGSLELRWATAPVLSE